MRGPDDLPTELAALKPGDQVLIPGGYFFDGESPVARPCVAVAVLKYRFQRGRRHFGWWAGTICGRTLRPEDILASGFEVDPPPYAPPRRKAWWEEPKSEPDTTDAEFEDLAGASA